MLLLTFLLIPNIFATPINIIGDYFVTIDNNVLINVIPSQSNNEHLNNTLNLSGLHISSIGKEAFDNVADIEILDLSRNDISVLQPGVFSHLRKLKRLSLANNALKNFYKAFAGLEHLEVLDISNLDIRQLGKSDLFGIPKSTDIIMIGDALHSISRGVFAETYANEFARAILCRHEGIVRSLEYWPDSKSRPTGCIGVPINFAYPHWIRLNQLGISGFDKDWYRLYNTQVDGLDLSGNNIVEITSELVDGLPYHLKFIDLSKNKIERVKKGSIVHANLEFLSLSDNLINEIESDAFITRHLYWLQLNGNRLNDIRFVASLPRNLLRLNLRNNQLSEIQLGQSFSSLNNLSNLDLAQNHITNLNKSYLVGLKSLRILALQENGLTKMDADCFERVPNLIALNLSNNYLADLEYNTFHPLIRIDRLDLSHNNLTTVPELLFSRLRSLSYLDLSNNRLTNLHHAFIGLFNLKLLNLLNNPFALPESDDFSRMSITANIISNGNKISSTALKDLLRGFPDDSEDPAILLCMSNGIVMAVRQRRPDDTPLPEACRIVKLMQYWQSGFDETALKLQNQQISGFAKNWYDLPVYVSMIILDSNAIVDVTSEMLNDLPEHVKYVYVRNNNIKRLKKGIVANKHLRALRLDYNEISEIEEDALVNTDLLEVTVSYNSLSGVQFLAGMPLTLKTLDASGNYITEIPAGSFSRLNKLRFLHLDNARINNIGPESFRGLSILKSLSLVQNNLTTIDKNAFQHTKILETLNLQSNQFQSLDKLLFNGLVNLLHVNLNFNKFTNITKDSLPYFPDALESLKLENNYISHIEPESFIGGLKHELSLYNNRLTTIDKDAFNFPDLVILKLSHNLLKRLNGDSFQNMPRLKKLYLDGNKITTLHKDAMKYLNKLYILDLSQNPITKLQNNELLGLSNLRDQKFDASIRVSATLIRHIHGGMFGDEPEASSTVVPM